MLATATLATETQRPTTGLFLGLQAIPPTYISSEIILALTSKAAEPADALSAA